MPAENSTTKISFKCKVCGKTFEKFPSAVKKGEGKHCSADCYNKDRGTPIDIRFWKYVRKTESCWIWTGAHHDRTGCGVLSKGHGKTRMKTAPRVSWELHNGKIPEGMFVCHKCDNPPCVNPDHLFLGYPIDNVRDMIAKGRNAIGERNGMAKLKLEDVIAIRKLRENGMLHREIAEIYNLHKRYICLICTNRRWKHVA